MRSVLFWDITQHIAVISCVCRAHLHNSFIFLYLFLFCVVFIRFMVLSLFLLIRPVYRDLYTTCVCMLIVRS